MQARLRCYASASQSPHCFQRQAVEQGCAESHGARHGIAWCQILLFDQWRYYLYEATPPLSVIKSTIDFACDLPSMFAMITRSQREGSGAPASAPATRPLQQQDGPRKRRKKAAFSRYVTDFSVTSMHSSRMLVSISPLHSNICKLIGSLRLSILLVRFWLQPDIDRSNMQISTCPTLRLCCMSE